MADLNTISIEELQAEINKRKTVEPLFEKDGKLYYDVSRYQELLNLLDEQGDMTDYTPVEFNKDGSARNVEPRHVCINIDAYLSNRVRYIATKKEYHLVTDTRTIRESESGNLTVMYVDEYILKANKVVEGGFTVQKSTVNREDFLKYYTDVFGVNDMLKILAIIDSERANLATGSTIELI